MTRRSTVLFPLGDQAPGQPPAENQDAANRRQEARRLAEDLLIGRHPAPEVEIVKGPQP